MDFDGVEGGPAVIADAHLDIAGCGRRGAAAGRHRAEGAVCLAARPKFQPAVASGEAVPLLTPTVVKVLEPE